MGKTQKGQECPWGGAGTRTQGLSRWGQGLPEDELRSWGCRGPVTEAWQGPSTVLRAPSVSPQVYTHVRQGPRRAEGALRATLLSPRPPRRPPLTGLASPSTGGARGEPGPAQLWLGTQRLALLSRDRSGPSGRLTGESSSQTRGLTQRLQTPDTGAGEIQFCTSAGASSLRRPS